jgi:hypothetical protein
MPGPLLVVTIVGLPIIAYMFAGGLYFGRYDVSAATAICGLGPWLLIFLINSGPKIAWDDKKVYMRTFSPGLRRRFPWLTMRSWSSLAYSHIASLDALTVNDPAARSFLLPFQLLRLTASGTDDEYDKRHIWLYSSALSDKELAPLLRRLDAKCPNMLPLVVRERLASWHDNH